jgi:hypothetical protein
MLNEIMSDFKTEAFCRTPLHQDVFKVTEKEPPESDHCLVICKKIGPNTFIIEKGLAFIAEENICGSDVRMMSCPTKTVFLFK